MPKGMTLFVLDWMSVNEEEKHHISVVIGMSGWAPNNHEIVFFF